MNNKNNQTTDLIILAITSIIGFLPYVIATVIPFIYAINFYNEIKETHFLYSVLGAFCVLLTGFKILLRVSADTSKFIIEQGCNMIGFDVQKYYREYNKRKTMEKYSTEEKAHHNYIKNKVKHALSDIEKCHYQEDVEDLMIEYFKLISVESRLVIIQSTIDYMKENDIKINFPTELLSKKPI
jgi:hypothetical protein